MTTLLYRGHSYTQVVQDQSKQLRYDRGVYAARQNDARPVRTLTYRGCSYSTGHESAGQAAGSFRYRGVNYSH
ncbi:MAG: hypothetical protein O2972_08305 [Cyanobacteria bacterium]|jgi:hypothetical protein|nr:hypothetical protein [Synechococcus sp. BS307-5m-G38]MDA0258672.1 hypothetical protein [Cyanobacteriota bacterium]